MKRKFFSVLFTLVLVLSMSMMMAPPALAATAVTDVWVQFTTSTYNKTDTATDFTIHFTPTTAMSRGVDTITVWFPDGTTAMGPDNFSLANAVTTNTYYDVDRDGEASTYSAVDCYSAAVLSTTGYRVTVTTPVDLDAGTACSLRIEAAAGVKCADSTSHSQYKVKVLTSQDTTPVLSDAFDIDATSPTSAALALSPTTAGSAGQYTFTLTLANAVAADGTVTVIFPYGTTVPSSVSADNVRVSTDGGSVYEACTVAPVVNQKARMVTITTPVILDADGNNVVRFTTAGNIKNPTTVKNSARTDCYVSTSVDELFVAETSGYNVTAGTAAKIGFNNDAYPASSYSDDASMINMYSSRLFVEVQDAYGNAKDPDTEPTLNFSSSQGSGIFYTNAETDGSGAFTQISSIATVSGKKTVYYKDSVAGTVTLTATATGYASGTWAMTIAPGVSLYDGNNNLIKTYAPTTISVASETGGTADETNTESSDYVTDAINASVAGDTVKLGDGIYESDDNGVDVDKAITLTSVNGAGSTTIRISESTSQNFVTLTSRATISGLHLQGWKPGDTVDYGAGTYGVYLGASGTSASYGYVKNCKLEGFYTGVCVSGNGVNYWKIEDNEFNNCRSGISSASANYWTISGNTFTNYLAGAGGTESVTNYTVTSNSFNGINSSALNAVLNLGACEGVGLAVSAATVVYTKNTFTGNDYGIQLYADCSSTLVKYNDITGNNSFGIYGASTSYEVSAKYNWWGDATGPGAGTGTYASGTAVGSGDAISSGHEATDYEPWLHKSKTDVIADNASYQAASMKLVAGWNTLSTPVKLISTADSIDELIPSGMTIGYYYDGGWQQITTGKVLNACDAVYVKMNAQTYVYLKFDAGAWTTPSKDLAAGWNLVSLASLDTTKTVANTMACVDNTAAGLPGWSQVISPSMNAAQTDMYGTAETAWAESAGEAAGQTLQPGLGYWTYMQNAATLAGFEVTPIVPDFD